jgi:hypothetical protein
VKVFEIDKADGGGLVVWRLNKHEDHAGDFFIESYGDPVLTADEFATMAAAVEKARDAPIPED